jgi:hypothetical protein
LQSWVISTCCDSQNKILNTIISILDNNFANELAAGNINPTSGINQDNFSHLRVHCLWKITKVSEVRDESAGMERQSIEEEQIESEVHTVPLKVLGSCHSGERQKILEEAFVYLNEYNRPVYMQLEKEPDNLHDPNAIAT